EDCALPRVVLCEHDQQLAGILIEVLADEHVAVTSCASLQEIEAELDLHPDAIVLTDSWTDSWQPNLSALERSDIACLAARTAVVITTGRAWAQRAAEAGLGPNVTVICKPFELDDLVNAVRAALSMSPD